MGIFDLFSSNRAPAKKTAKSEDLSAYNGMRVEVFDAAQRLLFVAALFVRSGGNAELRQFAGASAPVSMDGPTPVSLRGFDDHQRLAIHFSCVISPAADRVWTAERLTLTGKDNDRAFFRQATNATGEAVLLGWVGLQNGKPCEVRNISAGGVCIQTREEYPMGSKIVLRFELIRGKEMPALRCQVLRVTPKRGGIFEYGCKFVDMPRGTEDQIARAIMELQMRQQAMR